LLNIYMLSDYVCPPILKHIKSLPKFSDIVVNALLSEIRLNAILIF
jgi:hypothetical protein